MWRVAVYVYILYGEVPFKVKTFTTQGLKGATQGRNYATQGGNYT